jgi:hypothetical protein
MPQVAHTGPVSTVGQVARTEPAAVGVMQGTRMGLALVDNE